MGVRKTSFLKVAAFIIFAVTAFGTAVAGDRSAKEAEADMEWGYKAARRGYWQEALMRFEHANELTPDQPRILNNIAVAQEALGLFEQALLTYQTGLTLAPSNGSLQRNYARFQEFYSAYVAPPEEIEIKEAKEDEGVEDAQ